ncbi:type II toxin-antitoxin system antitoxin SocA domain-containing protein [Clostridium sp.]|uniref:type II toxin-antitoxin system antitoxin SocA domain-containing protein n=1 Tax=Clostridium sp. TaxID=1506 RepID=UPI003D6CD9C4
MNNLNVFCEHCRKDVDYTEKIEYMSAELKGEIYPYFGKTATCDECSNEIYVSEVNDYNLIQLYNEFRKKHNIISLEKILEIPRKYNIGKRPFSLLMGWGEQTFTRYYDGDMPTKQYSVILKKVYEDPNYYLSILEENKEKMKSQSAYEKSKIAAQSILGIEQISEIGKIDVTINYLLCKCEDITPLALQKLLYYVQGFYYAFMNRFIFEENCEAWVHGPVYRTVYNKYRGYCYDPIKCNDLITDIILSGSEKTIIDNVIKNLGGYSGKTLEAFTHLETPWLITRGDLPISSNTDREIDRQLISSYFTNVKQKYNMLNPSDIRAYSKVMFEQISL